MNSDWLVSRHIVIWMIAAYFINIMLLIEYIPWWILPLSGLVIGWRWFYVIGKVSVFNQVGQKSLTFAAIVMLIISSLNSGMMENMVNLLLLAYGLKFIELNKKRDVLVLVMLGFITIAIVFIYKESLLTTLVVAGSIVLQLSILVALNAPDVAWFGQLKTAFKIGALSLPLTVSLFLIMPQLGPLWSMSFASGATTGLSDNLSPGDIAQLRGSDALAFSVIFDDDVVPVKQRYWRALVLDQFDGRQWQQRVTPSRWRPYENDITWPDLSNEPSLSYKVIAKSSNQPWLFGLNIATSTDSDVKQLADLTLKYAMPVASTTAYRVTSYPNLARKLSLSKKQQQQNLQLPADSNQQTKRWVKEWRAKISDDHQFAEFVLKYFNQQPFYYTLNPPLLGEDSVDDFMFNTRQGFCSHYASAFSLIMRYAGIPSRVVTGYLGGEWNEEIGYLNVYQYDAHAWNEIWIAGLGWLRVDPTASIDAKRIVSTLENQQNQPFFGGNRFSLVRYKEVPWINSLRLSLANVEFYWSRWVVEYNNEKQQKLLEMLLGKLSSFKIITFTISLLLGIALLLWWQSGFKFRRLTPQQRFDRVYLTMVKQLERHDVIRAIHMSPNQYCQLVVAKYPVVSDEIRAFTHYYNDITYGSKTPVTKQDVQQLNRLLRQIVKKI
ncbi:MAG: DUF3488 domain-containing transglutaminase family protein [Gammaproteobacteria bacterium]|nr:DUF3488 domain-containing transglutaminase family protein [Gammaproteobacteria bacterium]